MRVPRRWVARLVTSALAAGTLAACGSSIASHPTTTTTTKPGTLSQRYTAIVSTGDKELQKLSTGLNKASGDVVTIQRDFASVAATYRGVAKAVRGLPFPASMQTHVAAMTTALDALVADATQGSQSVTVSQFNDVFTKLATDQKAEVTANTAVNHDLGISSIS